MKERGWTRSDNANRLLRTLFVTVPQCHCSCPDTVLCLDLSMDITRLATPP
jgi:hypothetical protein